MYNTVGETAGVTQDVGSDPTVGAPDPDVYHCCCTLCGTQLEEGWWEEGLVKEIVHEGREEEQEDEEEGLNVTVLGLGEMSRMEDEDEEMVDGEPDTTGDDQDKTSYFAGEDGDAKERCAERI